MRLRYEWIQNAEKIFLTFFVRGLNESHVKVEFKARALFLSIADPAADPPVAWDDRDARGSHIFTFNIHSLRHEIDPLQSKIELYPVGRWIMHALTEGAKGTYISVGFR